MLSTIGENIEYNGDIYHARHHVYVVSPTNNILSSNEEKLFSAIVTLHRHANVISFNLDHTSAPYFHRGHDKHSTCHDRHGNRDMCMID